MRSLICSLINLKGPISFVDSSKPKRLQRCIKAPVASERTERLGHVQNVRFCKVGRLLFDLLVVPYIDFVGDACMAAGLICPMTKDLSLY